MYRRTAGAAGRCMPTKCGITLVRMRSRQAGSVQAGVTFIFGKQGTGVSLAVRHSRPLYSVYLLFCCFTFWDEPIPRLSMADEPGTSRSATPDRHRSEW